MSKVVSHGQFCFKLVSKLCYYKGDKFNEKQTESTEPFSLEQPFYPLFDACSVSVDIFYSAFPAV